MRDAPFSGGSSLCSPSSRRCCAILGALLTGARSRAEQRSHGRGGSGGRLREAGSALPRRLLGPSRTAPLAPHGNTLHGPAARQGSGSPKALAQARAVPRWHWVRWPRWLRPVYRAHCTAGGAVRTPPTSPPLAAWWWCAFGKRQGDAHRYRAALQLLPLLIEGTSSTSCASPMLSFRFRNLAACVRGCSRRKLLGVDLSRTRSRRCAGRPCSRQASSQSSARRGQARPTHRPPRDARTDLTQRLLYASRCRAARADWCGFKVGAAARLRGGGSTRRRRGRDSPARLFAGQRTYC